MAILGCIADDFTGASDMASFLVKGGMKTVLYNEIPNDDKEEASDADAVVIALKTRTEDREKAVNLSLNAVKWLSEQNCQYFYIKYCSTFDSTKEGNIGPICDAVMEYLNVEYTLLCPSLPVNGRTVKDGKLYVNGVPLEESSMRNHPLTPMWDCDILELMKPQSRYPVYKIGRNLELWKNEKMAAHYYLVPDYEIEDDCKKILRRFGNLKLLTGGSGLAVELAKVLMKKKQNLDGKSLLLAGSCSVVTRSQISSYQKLGKCSIHLIPEMVFAGSWSIEDFWMDVRTYLMKDDVLVYTSAAPDKVKEAQEKFGNISEYLENIMAELASKAVEEGIRNIIVAGGETSGAVIKRLGMSSFLIGQSVAPGVPVMIPKENRKLRLILKSGNFGQEDFFERAISMMGERNE
ncbi:MAG: 3-oxo-tetronate kinase [Bariatricus sp.]